ncbi:glycosyltransferase family 4 protein [Wenyingzhuangia sp. IMCC45533]
MKILYVYDKMPRVYQNYLNILLKKIKCVDSLSYEETSTADICIRKNKLINKFIKVLYEMKAVKYPSLDYKFFYRYDIIHIQHSYLYKKVMSLKKHSNTKVVITLRGGDTYIKPWLDDRLVKFYKESYKFVDAFIVMSEHQKKYLNKNWRVSNEFIHVIPISFGEKNEAIPKFPNNDKLKLVSVFRMVWEKNINESLLFAKKLLELGINFEYDFYGGGNDLGQLYFLRDKYKLNNVVNIKGVIDNDVLKSKLSTYDLMLQFSFSEAFPTTILEAQSLGVPCIVSNAGGLTEAIIENETGYVSDGTSLEALCTKTIDLWKNKDRYLSFSNAAIEHVHKKFTVDNEISSLTKLYQSLLS